MVSYIDVYNIFNEKKCQFLMTREEFNKEKHIISEKYKYIAACGHENEVCLNAFRNRGRGINCPECAFIINCKKNKENNINDPIRCLNLEYDCILYFKELVKNIFEIKFIREGCLADIALKPLNTDSDLWLMIQVKSTFRPKYDYSFKCSSNYKNCIILCICQSDKKMWAFDGNNITTKHKIVIGLYKSKYSQFEINDNIKEKFINYYDNFPKYDLNSINIPINNYQQLEYGYSKYREEKIKLNFIYNEKQGLVFDFIVNNYKVQEKIGKINNTKNISCSFKLKKNNGKNNGQRKYTSYKKGDADFYWLNVPNKKDFYIIPENELIERKYINAKIKDLRINQKSKWVEEYLFDYTNPDIDKIKNMFKIK